MNLTKTMLIVAVGCVAIALTVALLHEKESSPGNKVVAPSSLSWAPHLGHTPSDWSYCSEATVAVKGAQKTGSRGPSFSICLVASVRADSGR